MSPEPETAAPATDLTVVLPYGPAGGSSRVRVLDWLDELGIAAHVLDYGGLPNNRPGTLVRHPVSTLRGEARARFAVPAGRPVLLSREATPFSAGGVEARILRRAAHGVYDFDDALFNDTGTGLRRLLAKDRKCEAAVRAADRVIAGNDYLADWAVRHNPDVTVIPSCVRPADYVQKTVWDLADPPRLVWMGSPSTEQYLHTIAEPLLRVHETHGARLTVISGPDGPSFGELDRMVDRVRWSADTFAAHLATADLGISPLTDTPYARGKSAYKLLQYAATALPVVGSPVGANALALQRFAGLAPCNGAKNGPTDRRRSSTRPLHNGVTAGSARIVEQHYSITSWAETWRDAVLPEQEWRAPAP